MPLSLLKYETALWNKGVGHIAGVDEAGKGPLAGPLVVAAVILDKAHLYTNNDIALTSLDFYAQINDSKKISPKKRQMLYDFIVKNAISYSIEEISNLNIDKWGIGKSDQIGFYNSVVNLKISPEHILTDHYEIHGIPKEKQTNITKGDSISISIAAASILAKVHRDRLMDKYHEKFPEYGFDRHRGYGTSFHRDQIKRLGLCKIHRKTFKTSF